MGGAVYPPCYLPGRKTMVEVMKIIVTSLKRTQSCTATVCAPSRPPPTHAFAGDFWTPTGKSPVWSLFLSPGSWCTRFCGALQECISQSYVSSDSSTVGLMATSSKRSYAIPTPKAPVPVADHCRPAPLQETLTILSRSLWGPWVLVHARFV